MKDQQNKKSVNRPEGKGQDSARTENPGQREVPTEFDRENRQGGRSPQGQQGSRNPQGQGSQIEDVGAEQMDRDLGSETPGRERDEERDRDRARTFQQPPAGKNK